MILLRNFSFATKYFDYKSKSEINETSNPKISGWYNVSNGVLSALLVLDNRLYFLFNDDEFLILDSHNVLLKRVSKDQNELNLLNGSDLVVRFSYSMPDSKLSTSPFEYLDEEDFNWGDFIAKIINDPEKKVSFVANLMER